MTKKETFARMLQTLLQIFLVLTHLFHGSSTHDDNSTNIDVTPESEITRPAIGKHTAGHNSDYYYQSSRPRNNYFIGQQQPQIGYNNGLYRWWNGVLNDVIVNRGYLGYDPRRDYERRRDYFYYTRQRQGGIVVINNNYTLPASAPPPVYYYTTTVAATTTTTTTATTTTTPPPYVIYYVRKPSTRAMPSDTTYY